MNNFNVLVRYLFGFSILFASLTGGAETVITDTPLTQNWIKRGIILEPGFAGSPSSEFVSSPSVVRLENGRLRMYVWVADGYPPWLEGRQVIVAAEADPANPFHWEVISEEPLLGPDPEVRIRDRGVGFPFVLPRNDGPWFMYYSTWWGDWSDKRELTNRSGLALSHDQGLTWRVEREDILPSGSPGSFDAGAIPSVAVHRNNRNDYLMWYTAAGKYVPFGEVNQGILHIGMARSSDGMNWDKHDQPALRAREGAVEPYEACLARPAVVKLDGVYHMWFGVYDMPPGSRPDGEDGKNRVDRYTSGSYRIEYARSTDGINWVRYADQPVLSLTPDGFDATSQTYPSIVDMGDQLWMFYTGDGLGRTGVGLATLDKSELRTE